MSPGGKYATRPAIAILMSIVTSYTSPEAADALKRQRRNSTIFSIIVSLLVLVVIGLIMAFILLPGFFIEAKSIIVYSSKTPEEKEVQKPETTTQVKRNPSAPSSSMAKVIASTTPSPTAIPVPEVAVPDLSMDFGTGDDFGEGWGSGGGGGGGGASFFGQKVSAEHIAYVIDFSSSMKSGGREPLMRKELGTSLDQITDGTNYALIFFAGPSWVAGSTVKGTTVTGEDGKKFMWKKGGGHNKWQHDGKKQPVDWLIATGRQLNASKKIVDETSLTGGTVWNNPLMMALDMKPLPQVIYFMTDGAANGSDIWAKEVGAEAKKLGVTINCVALMQPKAHDDMLAIAKTTGGQFTIVKDGGKREKVR